jgi:hypothetical protein
MLGEQSVSQMAVKRQGWFALTHKDRVHFDARRRRNSKGGILCCL